MRDDAVAMQFNIFIRVMIELRITLHIIIKYINL